MFEVIEEVIKTPYDTKITDQSIINLHNMVKFPYNRLFALIEGSRGLHLCEDEVRSWEGKEYSWDTFKKKVGQIYTDTGKPCPGGFYRVQTSKVIIEIFSDGVGSTF